MPFVTGGIQRHSSLLLDQLLKMKIDVDLYHTAPDQEQVLSACRFTQVTGENKGEMGNNFIEYPTSTKFPGHYLRSQIKLSRRFLSLVGGSPGKKYDFIYAQGLTGLTFVEAKARGASLPPIGINAHGYEMFQRSVNVREWAGKVMLRPFFRRQATQADFVFSFGGKIRKIVEDTLGVGSEKIIELPNAVDSDWLIKSGSIKRTEAGSLKFLFVGRYERRKGIEELNEVIESFQCANTTYHFVGPIPKNKQLHLPAAFYHGQVSDTAKLMAIFDSCDVLVCPSYSEGMPTVILEAMARGLAIIATDVGAVSAMVSSENGILLPDPQPAGLKKALERMARMESAELQGMKHASLSRVEAFTWDKVAENTVKAIQERI